MAEDGEEEDRAGGTADGGAEGKERPDLWCAERA